MRFGPHANQGTVEVCINSFWSSICHNSWDSRDAQVVCRQLGYATLGDKQSPIIYIVGFFYSISYIYQELLHDTHPIMDVLVVLYCWILWDVLEMRQAYCSAHIEE